MTAVSIKTRQKIDDLNHEAWITRVHDSERSFVASKKILALAEKNRYKKGIAYATLTYTFCLIRLSKYQEAFPYSRKCLSLFKELQEYRGMADACEQLGVIYRNWGKMSLALEHLVKALEIADQHDFLECRTTHHYQLGVTYKQLGNFDKALEHLYRTISLAEELKHKLYIAYATNVIGIIFFETGDPKKALEHFLAALAIRRKEGDKWGVAGSLGYTGLAYFKLKKYKQAVDYCRQSLAIAKKTGDRRGEANTLFYLAEIYEQTGDIRRSASCSEESLQLRRNSGDKRGEAEVLLFQAGLAGSKEKQREKLLRDVLKLAGSVRATDICSKVRKKLYEYYKSTGDHSKAIHELETHIRLEAQLHKSSVNQKMSNLEIAHEAEAAQKEAEITKSKNEELVKLNKELEIESSLERVRTVAMGMKKREDMLDICSVISKQLALLGVKEIRNVQTAIFYMEEGFYINYQYYAKHDKAFITDTVFTDHKIPLAFAEKMRKGKGQFSISHIKGRKEMDKWITYQQGTNVFIDSYLHTADSLSYYWYSLGEVAMGISTYQPLTREAMDLFQRFQNVFDLAYRRYLDIEKAAAQAREAQIEASLERVRTVAMSMTKEEDMLNIGRILFLELTQLGFIHLRNVLIGIFNDQEQFMLDFDYSDYAGGNMVRIPYGRNAIVDDHITKMKSASDAFSGFTMKGKELEAWKAYRRLNKEYEDKRLNGIPALYYYFYSLGTGSIGISAFEEILPEQLVLLKRFRNVFDLAYKRYIDIALATAQAKEARIEASLERMRAAAMSMHRSEDLIAVSEAMYKELTALGFTGIRNAQVSVKNNDGSYFVSEYSDYVSLAVKEAPIDNSPLLKKIYDEMERSKDAFFQAEFKGRQFRDWREWRRKAATEQDPRLVSAKSMWFHLYSLGNGYIGISTFEPITPDQTQILKRFRNVFELAYRRYADVANAEAQSREAQVQLALERVRARTMAMQHSEELSETVAVLFEQFQSLGEQPERMAIEMVNEEEKVFEIWATQHGGAQLNQVLKLSMDEPHVMQKMYQAWKKKIPSITIDLKGKELEAYFRFLQKAKLPVDKKIFGKRRVQNVATFSKGILTIITPEPRPAETIHLLERFAAVFDGTYTRFLDLQKAEAQAREGQIQLALERVRARTMAMHSSTELAETAAVLFEQFHLLGEAPERMSIETVNEKEKVYEIWATQHGGKLLDRMLRLSIDDLYLTKKMYSAWKAGDRSVTIDMQGVELEKFYKFLNGLGLKVDRVLFSKRRVQTSANFSKGSISIITLVPQPPATIAVLQRFAAVFEGTYTRFLDLQKAEAQAREAQIEVALERVRSKAMAMHKSEDLQDAVAVVFEELDKLNLGVLRVGISVLNKERRCGRVWLTSVDEGKAVQVSGDEPFDIHPLLKGSMDAWIRREDFSYQLEGEDLTSYYKAIEAEHFGLPASQMLSSDKGYKRQYCYVAVYHAGGLFAFRETDFPPEAKTVMKRFAAVFDLTYKRFLDIQKAEAQAREAQIEAGLERMRAKAMAMHNSHDVSAATAVMFNELRKLGVESMRCGIGILNRDSVMMDVWTATTTNAGHAIKGGGAIDITRHPLWMIMYDDWKAGKETFFYHLQGEDLKAYYKALTTSRNYSAPYIENIAPEHYCYATFFEDGLIFTFNYQVYTEEQKQILKRFASVFSLTYKRYKDLQRAEAQAKEAQIEVALERVRSKAMAMQKSEDLAYSVAIVFEELGKLDLGILRCGIAILNKEKQSAQVWTTARADNDAGVQVSGDQPMDTHPLFRNGFAAWINQEQDFNYVLQGEDLANYYKTLVKTGFLLPSSQLLTTGAGDTEHHYYNALFPAGGLFAFRESVFPDEAKIILRRFADVFNLTYTRFLDIQKAEEQAREARVETALERVRSRTLAMHKSDELSETAAELFRQLISLGIEPNRLYIGIVNSKTQDMEMWATDEEGSGVGRKFRFNAADNESVAKLYQGWKEKQKSVVVDMQGKELENYMKYLNRLGIPITHALTQKRRVQTVAYFSKGFIGMASPDGQGEETQSLLERFAAVFNLTFTRFNDLKIAEAHALQAEQDLVAIKEAKQKAEDTLAELQNTQRQLIQSEKMASLGELTAGIAHEIQNPLNFVNNFSEVSRELLEEMRTEIEKGNLGDAKEIMNDIIQNLNKINHHGKRADGIVKGMLQHSRSSTGQKEITDINALCDEYLRLAYHGLRAKDKSFNAKFETQFDEMIGKISIVPQEIGRVVLNLINNAFYAVSERKKNAGPGYEPTVRLITKYSGPGPGGTGNVDIVVSDNGTGIPEKVLEKIFQPFFTTKPTGQGTGLGLSLSYDIVTKGHGGELKAETKEGEGSVFMISLPVN